MKNSNNKQTKASFEKFNNTLDKKQMNMLSGGASASNGNNSIGNGTETGIAGVPIIVG
jgi:hypothetical protein